MLGKVRLASYFNKAQEQGQIAIVLSSQTVDLCYRDESTSHELHFYSQRVEDPTDLLTPLTQLLRELDVKGECQLTLSNSQYHAVQVDKPNVPDAELHAALPWQIKDLVPISPEDILLDYYQIPIENIAQQKLNVICSSLSTVKPITDFLFAQGIELKGITVADYAFCNLIPKSDDAHIVLYQQPMQELDIIIVKQGCLYFCRNLHGFSQIGDKTEQELAFGIIDSLSLEIQRSIDYYERQLKQAPIKQISVILPIASESKIIDMLANNTHLPVKSLQFPENYHVDRANAVSFGSLLELATESVT